MDVYCDKMVGICLDAGDWATWISSAATVLAVLVALWFGFADVRQRNEERRRGAGLYQWMFVPDVGCMVPALDGIEVVLRDIGGAEVGKRIEDSVLSYLDDLRALVSAPNINAHIPALVYLHPAVGEALARIAGNGATLSNYLGTLQKRPVIDEGMKKFAATMLPLLNAIRKDVSSTRWMETQQRFAHDQFEGAH